MSQPRKFSGLIAGRIKSSVPDGMMEKSCQILRMSVWPISSHEFSKRRRTIPLLLGEKAGMRESVKLIFVF
jgi:hypothetical protein